MKQKTQKVKEKSLIVKELEENEYCEIEYIEKKLFLNKKDITNIKNELFEILKFYIFSLQQSLDNQETELVRLFDQEILSSNIINQIDYQIIQHDKNDQDDKDGSINLRDDDYNDINQKLKQLTLLIQKELKNNILEKSYENILIQQYTSIIQMNEFISNNKNIRNLSSTPNLQMIQLTENKKQIINFQSPLIQLKNSLQIFDLQISLPLTILTLSIPCKQCEKISNIILEQKNQFLQKIKKQFILDQLIVGYTQIQCCDHFKDDLGEQELPLPGINLLFDDLSNLKYHQLQIYAYDLYEIKGNIKIIQNSYLKYLEIESYFFPIMEIQQKQNQFLSCLTLTQFQSYEFESIKLNLEQYLTKIRFSELKIIYLDSKQFYRLVDSQLLYYAQSKKHYYSPPLEDNVEIQIINKRYTNILCFFALHKLFNEDFSIYRLAYDLYEQ